MEAAVAVVVVVGGGDNDADGAKYSTSSSKSIVPELSLSINIKTISAIAFWVTIQDKDDGSNNEHSSSSSLFVEVVFPGINIAERNSANDTQPLPSVSILLNTVLTSLVEYSDGAFPCKNSVNSSMVIVPD